MRSDGTVTDEALDALFEERAGFCALCGFSINPELPPGHARALEWDHVTPRSRGGLHSISNLQPTHKKCNAKKRALLEEECWELFFDPMLFPEDRGIPDVFLPDEFPECRIGFGEP